MSKIYLGPMSKNIVDVSIEYSNALSFPITFIPSRRQIEYNGGYVNNWTTKEFCEYVKNKGDFVTIERDHGGSGQGLNVDNGIDSFKEDCKYMDIIHIDPWKKYPNYNDGLKETINAINFCYNENPDIIFEIATEESIRKFEVDELEKLILDLQKSLKPEIYKQIKYLVVQCGTGLLEANNNGLYDKERLKNMISLCKKYGFISKEHNGDWVAINLMKNKLNLGLDYINVAPELGEIETKIILNEINKIKNKNLKTTLFNKFYDLCFKSNKWIKWVTKEFIPEENKKKLIMICGHYVFSYPEFLDIKNEIPNIDEKIKKELLNKLREYHSLHDSYYKVLITTSGIGKRLGDITKYTNKSLIKVGDKLAICHIVEKYKKYVEYVVTLGYYGDFVKQFLELAYPDRKFTFVLIDTYEGASSSLVYSLLQARSALNCKFIFNCCDSLTDDCINIPKENTIYVNNNKNGTLYATITKSHNNYINNINNINKKGQIIFDYSYTGIAFIKDYNEYWNTLENIYTNNNQEKELSDVDVINKLLPKTKFKYVELNTWYDTGNVTDYNERVKNKYKCNYTVLDKNNESICFLNNSVIKFFHDKTVCINRVKRSNYLKELIPKIIDYRDNFFKMELIDGLLMSNNNKFGEINKLLNWAKQELWIERTPNFNFKESCIKFYKHKTLQRIKKYLDNYNDITIINDTNVSNIYNLIDKINFDWLCNSNATIYHGDFILDNIIKTDNIYKLIDWRQDFAGDLEFGDKYYDLAKLRHNIYLNHDNISNNLFTLEYINDYSVNIDLKCNYMLIRQIEDFDKFILDNDLDLFKVKILTSLIWINMAPLHQSPLNNFLYLFGKYNLCCLLNIQ